MRKLVVKLKKLNFLKVLQLKKVTMEFKLGDG